MRSWFTIKARSARNRKVGMKFRVIQSKTGEEAVKKRNQAIHQEVL